MVKADLGTAQAAEIVLSLIGSGAVIAVGFLMVDPLHFETLMQAIPRGGFVGVNRGALGAQGAGSCPISSAMVAAIGAGDVFTKGRDFAAWLGLVPKQISTGDRTILGKISRRGNRYLRVLFVQAAWVVLIKPKIWARHALNPSIDAARR